MNSININLRDLRYLVALADLRHFSKAAEACFVSQPTLSAQLKKLEETLGVQLVERTQRQVRLTPIGEEIVTRARSVLRETEQLVEAARHYQDPLSGPLHLGFIPTLGPYLLPYIIPELRRRYPELTPLLYEDQTQRLLKQLREGKLDATVLALPVDTKGLESVSLFNEPFKVALPRNHVLTRKVTLNMEELRDETILLLEEGHCLRDQALEICHSAHTRQRSNFQATSLETLRHMVGAGAGITLLPALAVDGPVANHPTVEVRPFAKPAPHRTIGMVWRRRTAKQKAIEAVGAVIRETMIQVLVD